MPKFIPSRPNLVNLPFPHGGLHEDSARDQQPPGTTPDALNTRSFAADGRDGGGQRPGLGKFITAAIKAVNTGVDEMDSLQFVSDQSFALVPAGATTIVANASGDKIDFKSGSTTYLQIATAGSTKYVMVPASGVNPQGHVYIVNDDSSNDVVAKYSATDDTLQWSTASGINIYSATNQTWGADASYLYVYGLQKFERFANSDGTKTEIDFGATITHWQPLTGGDQILVITAATLNIADIAGWTKSTQSYSGTIQHLDDDGTSIIVYTSTNVYVGNISTGAWTVIASANVKAFDSDATYYYIIEASAAKRILKADGTTVSISLTGTIRYIDSSDSVNYLIYTSSRAYKIPKASWSASTLTVADTWPASTPRRTSSYVYHRTASAAYKIDIAAWTATTITKTFTRWLVDTSTGSDDGYYLALTTTNKLTVIDQATWSAVDFDYGGTIKDYEFGIQETDYVYIAATRNASWTGHTGNATVFKVNATTGALVWATDTTQQPNAIATDSTGNVFVTGSNGSNKDKTWKIASGGSITTSDSDRFGTAAFSGSTYQGYSIAVDGADAVYIGVGASTGASTACDAAIIKYDNSLVYDSSAQIQQATGGTTMDCLPNYMEFNGSTLDIEVKENIDASISYSLYDIDDSLNITPGATGGSPTYATAPMVNYTTFTPTVSNVSWATEYSADPNGDGAAFSDTQTFTYSGTAITTLTTPIRKQLVIVSGTNIYDSENAGTALLVGASALSANFYDVQMACISNKAWFVDGTNYKVYDPSQPSGAQVDDWEASAGTEPWNGSPTPAVKLISAWLGQDRLVLSDGQTWYMPAAGNPKDFNYNPNPTSEDMAVAANTGLAGDLGDPITALIPYNSDRFIFGCNSTIHQMVGNPAAGGVFREITHEFGVAYGKAWATGPDGIVFFMSTQSGPCMIDSRGSVSSMVTDAKKGVSRLLTRFRAIDLNAYRIKMAWDTQYQGLHLIVVPIAGGASTHYWWEGRKNGWWKVQYTNPDHEPVCIHEYKGRTLANTAVLFGCRDGYIRSLSFANKSDDGTAINSYVNIVASPEKSGLAIQHCRLRTILPSSSDPLSYALYQGDSVAQALAASSVASGVISATGLATDLRDRAKGAAIVYRFGQSSLNKSWMLDNVMVGLLVKGPARRTVSA